MNENENDDLQIDPEHELAVEDPSYEQLQTELEKTKAALAEAQDLMLRAKADVENVRRRTRLDLENAHKYSIEKMAGELLHVVDGLEKGLEAAADSSHEHMASMRTGMELTYKLLISTLEKFKIHQIDPQGAPFDPKQHEALTTQPTSDVEPNTVITVVQKGYIIHDRVLRPARVIVSRAP